ncbi:MAG: hypothetical protein BECKG1743E_GA0114224_106525, partial [Candidatus Kentron sp. G]
MSDQRPLDDVSRSTPDPQEPHPIPIEAARQQARVLRPSKFEGHRPTIRHGCRMALMVALNWSVECVKE